MIFAVRVKGRTANGMMIKNKFSFYVGIWCGLCFVANVVNGRDLFVVGLTAVTAILNIILAFVER